MKMKLLKKILIILIPLCLFVNMVAFSSIENDYNEHNETFANKIDNEYHVIKLKEAIKYDDCILDAQAVNIYYADENGIWIDFYGIDDNENSVDKWNMALVGYDGSIRYYNKNDDLLNGLFVNMVAFSSIENDYNEHNETFANKIDNEYHVIKLKEAIKYDDCILDAQAVNIYYADENGIWIDFYGIDDNENSVDKWNMALVGYDGSIRYYNKNDDLLNGLFYDGIARVKIDDKYGYINESYNWVVPPIYNFATIFKDGMGFASKENNSGEIENFFFDNTGNVIFSTKGDFVKYHSSIATEYDKEENYEVFSNGYAEYNLNGKKYIIDKDLVPCQKNKI